MLMADGTLLIQAGDLFILGLPMAGHKRVLSLFLESFVMEFLPRPMDDSPWGDDSEPNPIFWQSNRRARYLNLEDQREQKDWIFFKVGDKIIREGVVIFETTE